MTVKEIAAYIDAEVVGDSNADIRGIASIEDATGGDVTFLANQKYRKYLESTSATAIIVDRQEDPSSLSNIQPNLILLRVSNPSAAFYKALEIFYPHVDLLPPGIHSSAVISESVETGEDVRVGANAVIDERARIGKGSMIGAGCVIGRDVQIEEDSVIYPNVSVGHGCKIGSRVIIHSGTVVGSDGFGFRPKGDGTYDKIPQTGIVVIEDDVEIGSNCSIDRATIGETRICRGAKLDNLIQIAHNVVVGDNTVIAAQTGISGSTKIGKQCIIAGQVGFVGHIEIGDEITIAAQSGVSKSFTKKGIYFGYPAREISKTMRIEGSLRQLPQMMKEFNELKRNIESLKKEKENAGPTKDY